MDITDQKKANNYINSKKFDKALKLCNKVLKATPNDDVAHMIIGIVYHRSNRLALAKKSLVHANKLNNKSVATLNNLSLVNDALGDYKSTVSCLKSGLEIDPTNKTLLENLARTHYVYGNYYQAAFQYKSNRMLGISGNYSELNLINSLSLAGEQAEALAEVEDIEEKLARKKGNELKTTIDLLSLDLFIMKLDLLHRLGRIEEVKSMIPSVEKLALNETQKSELVRLHATLGNKAAIFTIFQGIKFNKHTHPLILIDYCAHCDLTEDELRLIEQYLNTSPLENENYYLLAISLSKQFKKHKNIEKNKYWLKKANDKMKSDISNKDHISVLDRIMDLHKNKDIPYSNCQSKQPIFIIGMPRSGTTLLESMLSVHTDIHAAGELTLFNNTLKKLCPFLDDVTILEQEYRYFNELDRLTIDDLDKVADEYLKKSRAYVKPGAEYIIDKLPHNFLNIGLIHKVFPKAKIIYMKRNPISVCFSIYEQRFKMFHDYRFDLDYLADYYLKFDEMMSFWSEYLPENRIFEISYDELVAKPDSELTGLFEYLTLEKPDDILEFYNKESIVHTASLDQVRQPLYAKKKESWESMEDIIAPLIKKLNHLVNCK